jgi:hypothetical protein
MDEEERAQTEEARLRVAQTLEDRLDKLFHALCFKLFAHTRGQYSASQPLDKFFSPVICFAVIQCIHSSGAALQSSDMSQIIAALMYSIRICMLEEYAIVKQRDKLEQSK